jgi:hypothetical protein
MKITRGPAHASAVLDEYLHLPYLDPDDKLPGLGLTINEESMKEFQIIE